MYTENSIATMEKGARMKMVYMGAMLLLVIGGLNWGLVGLLNLDLVALLLGEMTMLSRLVYVLVGVSAVYVGVMTLMKSEK